MKMGIYERLPIDLSAIRLSLEGRRSGAVHAKGVIIIEIAKETKRAQLTKPDLASKK
jgi:hypothetical protein